VQHHNAPADARFRQMDKSFAANGFREFADVYGIEAMEVASAATDALAHRCRRGEASVLKDAVVVRQVTDRRPDRGSGDPLAVGTHEPFILGNLLAHDARFFSMLCHRPLWACAAACLSVDVSDLAFHFCNLTIKAPRVGPAIGWHRDAANAYFSAADHRTVRVLVPLDGMSELNGGTAVAVGSHADPAGCDPDRFVVVYPNVAPGSVLVLHPQVLHGGGPNRSMEPRRVMVVQFGVNGSKLLHRAAEQHALSSFSALTALARSSCAR